VLGALALGASERHAYSYREGELVYCLVEQYCSALEKDRLSISMDQRKREMDTLNQIGNFLSASTFDIERVLRHTMDMIGVMMNVEAGSLLLLENDELVFRVALNSNIDVLKKFRLKLGQGIIGYAAARGEPVIVRDVSASPHFYSEIDDETGFVTKSVLCVPMISQGKVIGAIEVLNKLNGDFDDNDVHLLQSIAASVTIALENARLYKETSAMAEQERSIRKMFQKFVPKDVVEKIIDVEEEERMLVGELKTLTFLNIDIRNFSRLYQSIGHQKIVAMLNYFFSTMGNIALQHKGIVDKYLGDGFLAIFGAVKTSVADADNAIAAALEMKEAMKNLNQHLQEAFGTTFEIGISINTGETVIGNIGFEQKMDYTVIGDAVNTVFRIQDMCRSLPDTILASEMTLRAARSQPRVHPLVGYARDETSESIRIYEVLGE
jgi:class 3 adenylate cyclase